MKTITLNLEDDEKAVAVDGYEGMYVVTDLGRVFSLLSGRFLNGCLSSHGYLQVKLYSAEHSKKNFRIHKLVARAFLPDWNKPGLEVDHINGDITDNRLINLQMLPHDKNIQKRDQEQLSKSLKLAMRNSTGQTHSKPCICIETNTFYWSTSEAAKSLGKEGKFGSNISLCCRGIIQSAYGYHWRYATEEEIKQHS